MRISVLWFFLTVPWVGLQWVIVAFSDHTHLLLDITVNQSEVKFEPFIQCSLN